MSGDYSRVSFDPSMDIASVLMQQGRVQIDSDWNTWVAALDRRMRAEAVDTFGVHPSPDKVGVAVVSPQTPDAFKIGGAIGSGLYGEYFDDINLTTCMLTRTDATVNFDWGGGSPDPLIGTDNFSVRWSGSVLALVTGNYTFHTISDDGVRLWVDNQKLIDNWTDHGAIENSSNSIALTAGQKYDIKLEYYEHLGAASIKLLWTPPGKTTQIIPQAQLFPPSITIGRGRMYVDGLLAENHGGGATEFDSVLAELRGKDTLFYSNQPYLPNSPALPDSGTHLAYLEVWQREATHHQLPDIVEKAVGVETATRVQTVWQVRFLGDDAAGKDCSMPDGEVPGWQNLIRPSGGRMSIQTGVVNTNTDPCELPVGGGYRGLENQLYRIEIHDGGGLGAATFKWSRENASVESNVMEIITNTKNKLRLASLGRDEVLRFSKDDWVEILDDVRELSGKNGDPTLRRGEMRKITDIDEANLTITLSTDLPGDMVADKATLAGRHTRVRRWDQKSEVRYADNTVCVADLNTTGGLIPVPNNGKWVVLEKNIQVQFSLAAAGGEFHSNDYWLSAARTADASMETFTQAPPRGIHRHYARLAMVSFPLQVGVDIPDCRVHWPPECGGCCTIIVSPHDPIGSIQKAIDSLPTEGGCVCLKTGTHKLNKTITIKSPNIALRGEGPGAIVYSKDLDVCLEVVEATSIIVEGIRFEAEYGNAMDVNTPKLLSLQDCRQVQVAHCSLAVLYNANSVQAVGILAETATDISVTSNRMEGVFRGILTQGDMGQLHIVDNTIAGDDSIIYKAGSPLENCGISVMPKQAPSCVIENNRISQFRVGIHARSLAQRAVITGNQISCSGGGAGDVKLTPQDLRSYLNSCPYAIIAEAALCEVRGNRITLDVTGGGGISASGEFAIVAENIVSPALGSKKPSSQTPAAIVPAIYCHGIADHASVRDNNLIGPQSGIIVSCIDAPIVSGNRIDSIEANQMAWYGVIVDDCTNARIENNGINNVLCGVLLALGADNRVICNRIGTVMWGVFSWNETDLEASGNTLQSCASIGMFLIVRGATAVLNNRVSNCGYVGGLSCGIFALSEEVLSLMDTGGNLRIDNCEIIDTGLSADSAQVTGVGAVGIAALAEACQITGNRVGYTQPDRLDAQLEHRALALIGPLSVYPPEKDNIGFVSSSALVSDNHFRGPGKNALVEFIRIEAKNKNFMIMLRFERVTFSNNICDHLYARKDEPMPVTVNLYGGDLIVMGNHVKGDKNVRSIESDGEKVVLLGNITTGDVPTIAAPGIYGDHNIKVVN